MGTQPRLAGRARKITRLRGREQRMEYLESPGAGGTHHFSCGAMLLNMILIIMASCATLA